MDMDYCASLPSTHIETSRGVELNPAYEHHMEKQREQGIDWSEDFKRSYINMDNKTVMIDTTYLKRIHIYDSDLARGRVCYVDAHFKYGSKSFSLTYLICGHHAGLAIAKKAKDAGISVDVGILRQDAPALPFLLSENEIIYEE